MSYPNLIYLDPVTKEKLTRFLYSEIDKHNMERSTWVNDITKANILYRARTDTLPGTQSPIKYGATIIVPLAAISIEAIHARNMTTLFALDQFTSLKLPDKFDEIDRDLERLIDHELLINANIYDVFDSVLLQTTKTGNGVAKTGWTETIRHAVKEDKDGKEIEFKVTTQRGSVVKAIPVTKFLMPFQYQDPNQSPWVGEEGELDEFGFDTLIESEYYYPDVKEEIKGWLTEGSGRTGTPGDQTRTNYEIEENRQPSFPTEFKTYHIWLCFDINGDGRKEEVVADFHLESSTLLSLRYNWHDDLRRPYHFTKHMPVENRWAAIGVCQQLEHMQEEVTAFHRLRLDNSALANLRMFKARRLSGITSDEPIFPGKIWMLDDLTDIEPMQAGEIYNSSYQNESQIVLYAQQRTGVNELTLGMPQVGTPGTAASDLARVQEGNRRHDYTYKSVRKFATGIIVDTICNIAQFGVSNVNLYDSLTQGTKVKDFIKGLSLTDIRQQVGITVGVAGQNQNTLLDRASWQQISQILLQYYTTSAQAITELKDPALQAEFLTKSLLGGTEAVRQILESFDVRNIDKILLNTKKLNQLIEDAINSAASSEGQAGGGGNSGISQPQGMGYVNPINTTVGGNA